jgi:hypothetical protein
MDTNTDSIPSFIATTFCSRTHYHQLSILLKYVTTEQLAFAFIYKDKNQPTSQYSGC